MKLTAMIPAGLLAIAPAAHADIIWNFYETSCATVFETTCGPVPSEPLLSMTVPAINSSLSAQVNLGTEAFGGPPIFTPFANFAGDPFTLTTINGDSLSSTAPYCGARVCIGEVEWPLGIIDLEFWNGPTQIDFRVNDGGGLIGSDLDLANCPTHTLCRVTGFWTDPVPEPASLALLGAMLITAWLASRGRQRRRQWDRPAVE